MGRYEGLPWPSSAVQRGLGGDRIRGMRGIHPVERELAVAVVVGSIVAVVTVRRVVVGGSRVRAAADGATAAVCVLVHLEIVVILTLPPDLVMTVTVTLIVVLDAIAAVRPVFVITTTVGIHWTADLTICSKSRVGAAVAVVQVGAKLAGVSIRARRVQKLSFPCPVAVPVKEKLLDAVAVPQMCVVFAVLVVIRVLLGCGARSQAIPGV